MTKEQLLQAVRAGEKIEFSQVMDVVAENYQYQPCSFSNGVGDQAVVNDAGQNEGSCKLFAFAKLNELSEAQTLELFGNYYHQDVLQNPDGSDHQNIRNFMQHGWSGITFTQMPLSEK